MKDTSPPEAVWPWTGGWTFSVPVDELFRDTASALAVAMDSRPFMLAFSCQNILAGLQLELDATSVEEVRTGADGIRIRYRSARDGEERLVSCAMVSPTTMTVEADEPCLRFIAIPEHEPSRDGLIRTISQGAHRLILAEQPVIAEQTYRMAVLSGTGDPAILAGRARAALTVGAHETLGRAWWPGGVSAGSSFTGAPDPLVYLRSRFRPSSVHLPAPWLAGPDEEPIWCPTVLTLAIHSLMPSFPQLAAALIQNLVELVDAEGGVPVAGGFRRPPETAAINPPLLLSLFMDYHRHTGTWPMDVDLAVNPLSRYLEYHLDQADVDGTAPWVLQRELVAWDAMYRLAGRPHDAIFNRVRAKSRAARLIKSAAADVTAAGILLAPDGVRIKGGMSESAALNEIGRKLTPEPSLRFPAGSWCMTVMIADRMAQVNHPSEQRWAERASAAARLHWAAALEEIRAAGDMSAAGPDMVAVAAARLWTGTIRHHRRVTGRRRTALAWWLNRRRKVLLATGFVLLALFIGWLALVQLRVSMPVSVFKTQTGLLLQHYQQKDYEAALAMGEEIKQRGHPEHPLVWMLQGRSLFQLGRYEEAIEAFAFAAERQPLDPAPGFNAALARFRMGDYEHAVAEFITVAETFARSHPSMATRARIAAQITLEIKP